MDSKQPTVESLATDVASLTKLVKKLQRQLNKISKHVEIPEPTTERKQSGFAKPQYISEQLAKFLGLDKDALIARTEVTQKITAYIKEHNLQNPDNKREILPDAALKDLLKPGPDDTLSFFTLQRYMAPHYPKVDKTVVPAKKEQASEPERPLSAGAKDVPAPPVPTKKTVVKKVVKRPVTAA